MHAYPACACLLALPCRAFAVLCTRCCYVSPVQYLTETEQVYPVSKHSKTSLFWYHKSMPCRALPCPSAHVGLSGCLWSVILVFVSLDLVPVVAKTLDLRYASEKEVLCSSLVEVPAAIQPISLSSRRRAVHRIVLHPRILVQLRNRRSEAILSCSSLTIDIEICS